MKHIFLAALCLCGIASYSQKIMEKEVQTKVGSVIVYTQGAQITRTKTVDLTKGTVLLKFTGLSPFIDPKSVQVKAAGPAMVLAVNHQLNYLDKTDKSKELQELQAKSDTLNEKIKLEKARLAIIAKELEFLTANQSIGGRNEALNVSNFKAVADFYHQKLTELKLGEIERNKQLERLNEQKRAIDNQISFLTGKIEFPEGEILVKVEAKVPAPVRFELSYVVANAGWFPSYDIRVQNINEPVQLVYKANVRQNTKENWENVALKFSSSDPNVNAVAPKLQTYFLNYHTRPPVYRLSSNQVRGKVTDSKNEPLAGVSVLVKGTTIGTVSDVNGNYALTLPENPGFLVFSMVGYVTEERAIAGEVINVQMMEDVAMLNEIVVVGYGTQSKVDVTGAAPGLTVRGASQRTKAPSPSIALPTVQVENQTAVEFEINMPYTVASDNKSYTLDLERYELPAYYEYYSVPKVNRDAFLMAYVVDWEKYNLLDGEASIYFEDAYVGKSLIDARYIADTLSISLGRDKNVAVKREKSKDFTTRQFIGTKKEEVKAWNISVKNNKSQTINIVIADQIPVSTLEEIEVEAKNLSGGELNKETGEVTWKFTLKPSEQKTFEFRYGVRYPKSRTLNIE